MRKIIFIFILMTFSIMFFPAISQAGQLDVLIQKLVDKGVLSQSEAQSVKHETRSAWENGTIPDWVEKIKVKGDFRLRYQWNKKEDGEGRNRGRYRLRLGFDTKVNDNLKVGFGLATGGTDPRSTNQTFTNTFETPDIRLDYAFVKYSPMSYMTLYGGKFKRKPVIWQTSDLLWDGDINPEGGALVLSREANDDLDLFLNTGVFVLDESSSDTSNPTMYFMQPGLKWQISDDIHLKTAVAYYGFSGVKGASLDHSAGTNSLDSDSHLLYNYNVVNPSIELGIKEPFDSFLPYFAVFGEYVYNSDPADNNSGYLAGIKFGDKKVKDQGQWQTKYMYRHIEKDAWLDTFPDSDFYGGDTGVEGHEIVFSYALAKHVIFGLDYYYSSNIKSTKIAENLVQADLVLKF